MPLSTHSSDLTELAWRRADVLRQIERLLLRQNIVGEWSPDRLAEYRKLRNEEQNLKAQSAQLRAELAGQRSTRPVTETLVVHE